MNAIIYDFQTCSIRKGDQTLTSNIKPDFSFPYDALSYDGIDVGTYQYENVRGELTELQIQEIKDYIETVVADPVAQLNVDSKNYLDKTDWYIIRKAETGVGIPTDILLAREAARLAIVGS